VTEPPSGAAPPVTAELREGGTLDLHALAEQICKRYRAEFPDEQERYGDAGVAWCIHDNQHILNWAVIESNGLGGFERKLAWLAAVLEARDFPLERLARNLELAAAVLDDNGEPRPGPAKVLAGGARFVRSTPSFLSAPD
jgi:hypothetical protein